MVTPSRAPGEGGTALVPCVQLGPLLPLLSLLLLVPGCPGTCPEVDMVESPGGLAVTEEEHPDGWGSPDCGACHATSVLHSRGCSEGVDDAEIRLRVEEEGLECCADCHGDNGVQP